MDCTIKKTLNLQAGTGVAVRAYSTDIWSADYVFFVDKKPIGIIEAKRAVEGTGTTIEHLTGKVLRKVKFHIHL